MSDGGVLSHDPEVRAILESEWRAEGRTLQLIASENFASPAVLAATGSVLTNRFADGAANARRYGSAATLADPDELARQRACRLFGAEHANVQPHAGSVANLAVLLALADPGSAVMGMSMEQGGHLSHGQPINASGQLYRSVLYGVDEDTERLDFDRIADLAEQAQPRLVFCGATAYPRVIDPHPFRAICDAVGALLVFDAAHVGGLIAGEAHPNPTDVADVVTLTTHKTLRGPRGGAILCRRGYARAIDQAVTPGVQGGPLAHVIAAKAVAFGEALRPEFRTYAANIVANARALGHACERLGLRQVTGGTDTHIVMLDLRPFDASLTGRAAEAALDRVGISVTRCPVPGDPRLPGDTSGIRVGSAALTTVGMGVGQMAEIAELLAAALHGRDDPVSGRWIRDEVARVAADFPPYPRRPSDSG